MTPNRKPSASQRSAELAGRRRGAHLGLVVVGGHVARGGDQAALLPLPLRLAAAVEEVRHMGVLLGLRDVQLALSPLGEHLGERDVRLAAGANATG